LTRSVASFALVRRDEIWSLGAEPALLEERLIHGSANLSGAQLTASDTLDPSLLTLCDDLVRRARDPLRTMAEGRARLIVSAQREGDQVRGEAWFNVTVAGLSIISAPESVAIDYERLIEIASIRPTATVSYRGIPIVWKNGSAAVLLHEAAGHAAEHLHAPIRWPPWLSVRDEPASGDAIDLLAGEAPRTLRRESFSDIPLPRLSNVVAQQQDVSIEGGGTRIEVHLISGGLYEPLTETVTIRIAAADLIDGDRVERVRPFEIVETRYDVAAAIRGAEGDPIRYPGVVCSREGQEIVVGSAAPAMLTVF
jgi:hypothetical protein